MCHEGRDTQAMWSNKRANVYPNNPEASWHSGRVYVDYCNALAGVADAQHKEATPPQLLRSARQGPTQPLRVQHCHRARPIRNSRAAGLIHQWLEACQARLPPCQKVSGQPETDANLKVSRTGEKLRSSTHTHYSISRNNGIHGSRFEQAGLVAVRWKACDVLIANRRDS